MRIVIAIPVLNEENVLRPTVEKVLAASARLAGDEIVLVIADNGSTDKTREIGTALAAEHHQVRYRRLETRGKGLAIRTVWAENPADVAVFMDADLATDLAALPDLVRAAADGGGMSVGSRFLPGSRVERSLFRKILSFGYRAFARAALETRISDLPCGFKAASAAVVRRVMPEVADNGWFFDTELVVRAERAGFAVREIPAAWSDSRTPGRESKVPVWRLIREYVRKVVGLKRALGSAGGRADLTLGRLIKSITPGEWRVVAVLAVVAAAATSIPPLYGLYLAYIRDSVWNGRQFLSAGDFNVYLSYIEQVKQGRFLLVNLYTTERLTPVLNIFWLGVGWLARLFQLSPLAAFHAARVLLIPPLAAVAYCFISYFFRESKLRVVTLIMFLFGSGVGIYFAPFFLVDAAGPRYQWPIDMWVAEGNAFMTMMYSPHFIASLLLILLALLFLLLSFESGRLSYAAAAGLSALVLFEFHPFHAPTLYAVPAVWLSWRAVRGRFRAGQWLAYVVFAALSLPAVAYHYYLTHHDQAAAALLNSNLTLTPWPWHLFIGLGAISVLWVFGFRLERRRVGGDAARWDFLAVWVVVQALLIYAPLTFQRRMIEGIQFPLTLLAVPAIVWLYRRSWRGFKAGRLYRLSVSLVLASAVFLPSTYSAVFRSLDVYIYDPSPHFFHTREQAAALEWLRTSTPADAVVFGSLESGNVIPGWSGRRVYAGHWQTTIDLVPKADEMIDFFGSMDDRMKLKFAVDHGINYVYCGPSEQALGGCPSDPALWSPAFRSGDTVIYQALGAAPGPAISAPPASL